MDIGDIDTSLGVLLRLHALREGHGLRLHTSIGTESSNRIHPFCCRMDGRQGTIGIELELFDGYTATEASASRQFTRMVEEVMMPLVISNATMVRERSHV